MGLKRKRYKGKIFLKYTGETALYILKNVPGAMQYIKARYTLDGEQELQVHKLLHRAQDGRCLAELPGFNIAQLRISYRELEQLAEKRAGRCKSCKNLNFPLAFWPIRAIIVRQSFPRPLDGVADIEGCDGHIH